MSSQSFAALGLSRAIVDVLAARGITTTFPVQSLVVPDVLAGKDVLVESPTGSGKTLAFAAPLVESLRPADPRPSALVLVPTRELAAQIVAETSPLAKARGLSVTAIYGGAAIERQIRLAPRSHILVATPGRLEDLLSRKTVDLRQVRTLVLDEADRMLDMGFRPAVDRIVSHLPRARQTLLFSATLDGDVSLLADAYTTEPRHHQHAPARERRSEVRHRFVSVKPSSKLDALVNELRADDRGLTLVFVRTKRGADRLVKRLRSSELEALSIHGDKSQAQREKALASFKAGRVDTLVATDVAARGLDIDDITHVINFDAPADRDAYVHRVGRTGRAGRSGVGVTFVAGDQADDIHKIARDLRLEKEFVRSGFQAAKRAGGGHGASQRRRDHRRPRGR